MRVQLEKRGVLGAGQVKKGGSLPRHIPILNIYVSTPPPPPRGFHSFNNLLCYLAPYLFFTFLRAYSHAQTNALTHTHINEICIMIFAEFLGTVPALVVLSPTSGNYIIVEIKSSTDY